MRRGPMALLGALLALAGVGSGARGQAGIVRFDFESGDLQGWRVVEGSFPKLLTDRPLFHHVNTPYNKQGKYFLSTLETPGGEPDDRPTGVVESPVFVLAGAEMSLLVGGGNHPDTYVALCTLDGKEVLKAQGANAQELQRVTWKAPQLVGQKVFLRVVDHNTGGWGHVTLDDFTAQGTIDAAATERNFAGARLRRLRREMDARVQEANPEALRKAVEDLAATFPTEYRRGPEFLQKLDALQQRLAEPLKAEDAKALEQQAALLQELAALQREALLVNPLLTRHLILFVVRPQYRPDHHNTETMFQTGEINTGSFQGGGALKALDVATGQVRTLVSLPEGMVRDPEVSFDGRRVVFSLRKNIREDYHLWEINADGTGLRQLTSAPGVTDIDPLYLPDGDILFSSTREPKYCMCNRHIMCNLFRMEPDGANIHQIGKSTLFEGHSTLLPDGRILYDRWEYVDRNFGDAQGLWACNPDGTNHCVVYGNNTPAPGAVIDARPIPGTERILCIFGSCHDRPWGALAMLDPRAGVDGRAPVVRTWPADAVNRVREPGTDNNDWDAFSSVRPKYEDPYPLNDKYFLCARMTGKGEQMGIYLVDVFGNELLVHAEEPGCFDPMPLGPHERPPVVPTRRDFRNAEGYFYVENVYAGTHMKGVVPGSVKWLRVVESPEKRAWTNPAWSGQGTIAPAMNWHDFSNKRILGTVPVEADGSAYFAVPSDKFVYFQLLDEKGMMVQSMRSGTIVQSGERTGCIGCHDSRGAGAPVGARAPLAMQRPASRLQGWHGEPRLFSYMKEIQPVWDRYCVKCHDFGGPAAKKLILAGDRNPAFNTSYTELWRKGYLHVVGAGPAETQPALSWGARASKILEHINKPNGGVMMDDESRERVIAWLDINAPYYPTYDSAYPDNLYGRCPLDNRQMERLKQLGVWAGDPEQIVFDRPELSPGLAGKSDEVRKEALAILQAGKEMLARRPRADMDGFQPCPLDQQREAKYAARQQVELRNREAIRTGKKVYDREGP